MSKMSNIHAAASEIDTTDADAVRQLADELAAEDYAPIVARTSDTIRRIVWSQTSLDGGASEALADRIATEIHAADVAVRSDAIARVIESSADACYACGDTFGRYVSGGAEHCGQCHAAQSDPA